MKKLKFEKLTDVSELCDFYCGIDTIDTFLHGDFQDYQQYEHINQKHTQLFLFMRSAVSIQQKSFRKLSPHCVCIES